MSRHELTKHQWKIIEPLLPKRIKKIGRPQVDQKKTLNGIIYVLKTGRDLPRKYGSPTTCWRRLKQWKKDGTWERIWRGLLSWLDEKGVIDWSRGFLDGSFVPSKRGGSHIGKTRVGKGSKIMYIADRKGLPISIHMASTQIHEVKLAQPTLASIRVPQKRGRPHSRLLELVADKAYDSKEFRAFLRKRGTKPTIPERKKQKKRSPTGTGRRVQRTLEN